MIRNYILTALRIMIRQKAYSVINIAGLTLGIATTLMIILYVVDEFSYDRFHLQAENIYRINFSGKLQSNEINVAASPAPLAEALLNEYSDVTDVVRFTVWRTMPMAYQDKIFTESHFLVADSNFFRFFNFEVLKGDPATALTGPDKIAITETVAKKYFGNENPIGKIMLRGSEKAASMITAVIKDPPSNSHIDFDIILSGQSFNYFKDPNWLNNGLYTYVRLRSNATEAKLKKELGQLVEKYMGPEIQKFSGGSLKQFRQQGNNVGLNLQPLTDIHLKSDLTDEITPNGNIQYLYIFIAIAVFIILIACINFMNLSTARSANRAKEVGVRKTVGALRSKIILQFLSESVLYSLLSTILAVASIAVFLPTFNIISAKSLSLDFINDPLIIGLIVLFTIVVGLLAGSYPAIYLTSFKPNEVLKGKLRSGFRNASLRNILVTFQFMISISLIFGSLVMFYQLKFMQEKNLGFNKENVVNLLHTMTLGKNAEVFKNEINSRAEFKGASFVNRVPPNFGWTSAFRKAGTDHDYLLTIYAVDHDNMQTMGYSLMNGRFFSKDFPSDSVAIILNESAYKYMGYTNLEEAEVISYNNEQPTTLRVIGIVKDFNFDNLKSTIKPLGIVMGATPNYEMAIRLSPGNTINQIELLEELWKKYSPGAPFEYSFVDQNFDQLFRSEQRLTEIIFVFTILAITIACLGLFGLAAYTAEQRAKEISIRKVMGASVSQLMLLLSKDFALIVIIAFVIATPIAWYFAEGWLQQFANRIQLEGWMFVLSGLISLSIAIFTISYQAFSAARENPVNAMRGD